MEYLYTNLPRYITVTPRSAFANSVVQSGSVLLFSEDGTTLTAKLPDGSFITVGGSGGTDVSDTTAEAGDVLAGKIFYNSGGIQTTGTIPTVSAAIESGAVVVPAGYIQNSQSFPVSAGDTDFYKCATVNTANQTWTGYKAVLADGVYSFESTATSGLIYSVITPEVGKVYADGALVQIADLYDGMPAAGLVFHAPLDAPRQLAKTDQLLIANGTITYGTYKGVPCALFDGSSHIDITDLTKFNTCYTNDAITISLWLCGNGGYSYYDGIFTAQNGNAPTDWQWAVFNQGNANTIDMYLNGTNADVDYAITDDTWYHFCMVGGSGSWKFYVNGSDITSGTCNAIQQITNMVRIGWWDAAYGQYHGRLAGLRVYNRALTDVEIAALAAEFTPSAV